MTPGASGDSRVLTFLWFYDIGKDRTVDRKNDSKECRHGWKGKYYPPPQFTFMKTLRYAVGTKQLSSNWKINMSPSCVRKNVTRVRLLNC